MCFLCEKLKEYQLTILAVILGVAMVISVAMITNAMTKKIFI